MISPILIAVALIFAILSLHSVTTTLPQSAADSLPVSTVVGNEAAETAPDMGHLDLENAIVSTERVISDRDEQYCAEPSTCIETASVVSSPLAAQTSPSPMLTASQLGLFHDGGGLASMIAATEPPSLSSAVIRV